MIQTREVTTRTTRTRTMRMSKKSTLPTSLPWQRLRCSPRLMGLSTPSPFAPRGAADALTRRRTERHQGRTQGNVNVERAGSPAPGGTLTKLWGGGRWMICGLSQPVCKQCGVHRGHGADERRSASNVGSGSVARAHIECSVAWPAECAVHLS